MKKELLKLLDEAMTIASEAITLAEEYAGGDSETAQELSYQYEELELKIKKLNEEH